MSFPSSIPSYQGYVASETLSAANNAAQLNQMQSDAIGLATKLGTGASTPTSTSVLVGNGTGTSTWGQVNLSNMVSSVLPVNSGGTGTTSTTGTGSVVYSNAPTINTPTENNGTYNNATLPTPNITYSNNSIPAAAVVNNSLGLNQLETNLNLPTITNNPYKFYATWAGANNWFTTSMQTIPLDTAVINTGSVYSVSTHAFTAPVTGIYYVAAMITINNGSTPAYCNMQLNKNSGTIIDYSSISSNGTGAYFTVKAGGNLYPLNAGDTVVVQGTSGGTWGLSSAAGPSATFCAFLESAT